MNRKVIIKLILTFAFALFVNMHFQEVAAAEETPPISYMEITGYPSKTEYITGESLDLSDMILTGYFQDSTVRTITDYNVSGFDSSKIGSQLVVINYQNQYKAFSVIVKPGKVTNVRADNQAANSVTLSWDAFEGVSRYEIYGLDEWSGEYKYILHTVGTSATLYFISGSTQSYRICALATIDGVEYRGEMSDTYTVASAPGEMTQVTAPDVTDTSVTLKWSKVTGASGYLIYRSPDTNGNYKKIGKTTGTEYTDKSLTSATGYIYKVCAYSLDETLTGPFSDEIYVSTNPKKPVISSGKGGDARLRIAWAKVTGASYYDVYYSDNDSDYTFYKSIDANGELSCIIDGLNNDTAYSVYIKAVRDYRESKYYSRPSDIMSIRTAAVGPTGTQPRLFPTIVEFMGSSAYKGISFFSSNVDFDKSIVIPGLALTNTGGFASMSMCPQGLTIADEYVLLSAYDMASEENSVIYVIDKASHELLTVLVLPVKTHVGGIAYDGEHVWVTIDKKVCPISLSVIREAALDDSEYSFIELPVSIELGIWASYITYHDGLLWVGSYNELKSTNMHGYAIQDTENKLSLVKTYTILMPDRVQGIAFTDSGHLIISRSCQLYAGLRGYMRQLDVYKPDFEAATDGVVLLGSPVNSVEMPSMNEEIVIDDGYLYVNFESAAFSAASYKVDRICAFPLEAVIK